MLEKRGCAKAPRIGQSVLIRGRADLSTAADLALMLALQEFQRWLDDGEQHAEPQRHLGSREVPSKMERLQNELENEVCTNAGLRLSPRRGGHPKRPLEHGLSH
jgi:hypothetical protein